MLDNETADCSSGIADGTQSRPLAGVQRLHAVHTTTTRRQGPPGVRTTSESGGSQCGCRQCATKCNQTSLEGLAAADVQSVGYQTRATAVRFALTPWAARLRACGEPMHQWLQGWNSAVAATDMPAQTSPERCRVGGQMRRRGAMCVMRERGHADCKIHRLAKLWSSGWRTAADGCACARLLPLHRPGKASGEGRRRLIQHAYR